MVSFFFKVFFFNQSIILLKKLNLDKMFNIVSIKNKTNGMMMILASKQIKKALIGFISKRAAAINPPRSSKMGIKEMMKIKMYLPSNVLVKAPNAPKIYVTNFLAKTIFLLKY